MTFHRSHLDIALIEVSRSEMSSEEIYTAVRQIDLNTNIFIFMGDETAANARSSVDASIVRKPCSTSELITTIEELTKFWMLLYEGRAARPRVIVIETGSVQRKFRQSG